MKRTKQVIFVLALSMLMISISGCHGYKKQHRGGMCAKRHQARKCEKPCPQCPRIKGEMSEKCMHCKGKPACETCKMKGTKDCPRHKMMKMHKDGHGAEMHKACAHCKSMMDKCPKCKELGKMCPDCMKKRMQCPYCGAKDKQAAPAEASESCATCM